MRAHTIVVMIVMAGLSVDADAQTQNPNDIHLICLGGGSANKLRSTNVYAHDSDGNSAWGNALAQRDVPFDDQVSIDLVGGEGRIRMPRTMLPPLHGGDGGWFKLKNLQLSEREITASVGVNFMNSPKLRIDRITGRVSLSGKAGDFSGECQPYDPATVTRKF